LPGASLFGKLEQSDECTCALGFVIVDRSIHPIDRSIVFSSLRGIPEQGRVLNANVYAHVASDSVLPFAFSIRDGVVNTREGETEREKERERGEERHPPALLT